jgi:hypothetical protein
MKKLHRIGRAVAALAGVAAFALSTADAGGGRGIVSEIYIRTRSPVASETRIDVTSGRAEMQIIANSVVNIEIWLGRTRVAVVRGADLRLGGQYGPARVTAVSTVDANRRRYTFDLRLSPTAPHGTGNIGAVRVVSSGGSVLFDEDPIFRSATGG